MPLSSSITDATSETLGEGTRSHQSGPVIDVSPALRDYLDRHGDTIGKRGDGFTRRHNYVERSIGVGAELSAIGVPTEPAALPPSELVPATASDYRTSAMTAPEGAFTAALRVEKDAVYMYSRSEIAALAQPTWSFDWDDVGYFVPILFGTTMALGAFLTLGAFLFLR